MTDPPFAIFITPPGQPAVHPDAQIFEPVIILKRHNLVMREGARVDGFTKIEGGDGVYLGRDVHIASHCHINIGGGIVIFEDGSCAASGVRVLGGSARADAVSCSATSPLAVNEKAVTRIGKNAALFVGVTVCHGATIGEGARILPHAVVSKDAVVGPGETWAGVPARRIL